MRAAAIVMIAAVAMSTPACAGPRIHGLDAAAWMELLSGDLPLPIRNGDRPDLDALQSLGPGALLFVGMAAEDRGEAELALALYTAAAEREEGRYKARAAALAASALEKAGDGQGLLSLCRSASGSGLPPFRRAWLEARALSMAGDHAAAQAALASLRSAYPSESAGIAAQAAALSFESSFQAGKGRWSDDLAALSGMEGSQAAYEALAKAVALVASAGREGAEDAVRAMGASAFSLVEARALAGARDYRKAVFAWRRLAEDADTPETIAARLAAGLPEPEAATGPSQGPAEGLSPSAPPDEPGPLRPARLARLLRILSRPAASDAARSFLSASKAEGAAAFAYLAEELGDWSSYPSRKYFELFWHGRFLREAERWKEARSAFLSAAKAAADAAEAEAAMWFAVECASKAQAADAVALLGQALSQAAKAGRDPAYFSDLIEPLSREALARRDGGQLAALDAAAGRLASPADRARLAFICGRAAQVGIIRDADLSAAFGKEAAPRSEYAVSRLRAAYDAKASSWYRLAAAYRLGEPLVDPLAIESGAQEPEDTPAGRPGPGAEPSSAPGAPSASPRAPAASPAGPASTGPAAGGASLPGPDEYALALARFGQGARLRAELGVEFSALNPLTVRSVASTLSASGRHSAAYRLIATQFWKASFSPARADAELYWPRPFADSFAAAQAASGLDLHLLYGIARSESAFDPGAVSKSGAVGLIQLMPPTAEETARRLRLSEWSMTDVDDNLAIGSAYFARILSQLGGRVLPAVFSYNAGPNRFKRWEAELGGLPADLLLEALPFAETRQYGRNVAGAALAYAALYGEVDLRAYFAYLLGEGPKPGSAD